MSGLLEDYIYSLCTLHLWSIKHFISFSHMSISTNLKIKMGIYIATLEVHIIWSANYSDHILQGLLYVNVTSMFCLDILVDNVAFDVDLTILLWVPIRCKAGNIIWDIRLKRIWLISKRTEHRVESHHSYIRPRQKVWIIEEYSCIAWQNWHETDSNK